MPIAWSAIPPVLHPYAGRIMDIDSHEYTPVNHWVDRFGQITKPFVDALMVSKLPIRAHVEHDDTPIDDHGVWKTKFGRAPGAFDFKRRLEVLDYTGVQKQIV